MILGFHALRFAHFQRPPAILGSVEMSGFCPACHSLVHPPRNVSSDILHNFQSVGITVLALLEPVLKYGFPMRTTQMHVEGYGNCPDE
jgi:hypothetical protein